MVLSKTIPTSHIDIVTSVKRKWKGTGSTDAIQKPLRTDDGILNRLIHKSIICHHRFCQRRSQENTVLQLLLLVSSNIINILLSAVTIVRWRTIVLSNLTYTETYNYPWTDPKWSFYRQAPPRAIPTKTQNHTHRCMSQLLLQLQA